MSEYKYWIFAIILVISFVVVAFLCVFKDSENRYKFGVWGWGIVGCIIGCLAFIYVCQNFCSGKKDVAPVLASLVATIGIVWSWFFQLAQKHKHHIDNLEIEKEKLSFEKEKFLISIKGN